GSGNPKRLRYRVACSVRFCFKPLFLWWFGGPHFDFTRQGSWMHSKKIKNQLTDIFRLYFPGIGITGYMSIEMRCERAWHNGTHFHVIMPQIQHYSLSESDQSKFTGIIGGSAGEEIGPSQTGNRNDISFGFFDSRNCRFYAMEHARKVSINGLVP